MYLNFGIIVLANFNSAFIFHSRFLTSKSVFAKGSGDIISQYFGDLWLLSRANKLNKNVVPDRGNPVTKIGYGLPKKTDVQINIYNLKGETVATIVNEKGIDAGFHFALWNSSNSLGNPVAAGVYIYQIRAGDFIKSRKLILLK